MSRLVRRVESDKPWWKQTYLIGWSSTREAGRKGQILWLVLIAIAFYVLHHWVF